MLRPATKNLAAMKAHRERRGIPRLYRADPGGSRFTQQNICIAQCGLLERKVMTWTPPARSSLLS